jgi:4-hydroxythreonine-4-phosphate dehydrogenase
VPTCGLEMSKKHKKRPAIGITIGDAAGIGPEIVLKAVRSRELRSEIRCVIIGDAGHIRRQSLRFEDSLTLIPFQEGTEAGTDAVEVFDLDNLPDEFAKGRDDVVTGKAAGECIVEAVNLWRSGKIDAIATAPISKNAIAMGGFNFPGHTEFLAELTGTPEFAMSFFAGSLRVVLLSTHLPILDAIALVTEEKLRDLIRFSNAQISRLLAKKVSIAVAGLNPHASEGGMFGRQETEIIEPAIRSCRAEGIEVTGPYSPDTIFLRGYRGEFDVCIALYHDQATIAVKSISFGSGVNVTIGLPLIRTSVDHGTAYDIVDRGIADESSMKAAIELAGELASVSRNAGVF